VHPAPSWLRIRSGVSNHGPAAINDEDFDWQLAPGLSALRDAEELDGEVVAVDDKGRSDFGALQEAFARIRRRER
jgi:hypothetical protein